MKCESPPEPVKCPPEPNPCQGDNSNDGGKGNSFLKWLIGGALVAGGIAGFMYYNNLNNSGKTSDHSGDASGTKKKDKIVEKCMLSHINFKILLTLMLDSFQFDRPNRQVISPNMYLTS